MKFDKMQEALDHYGLGTLNKGYDTRHSYGETDKGVNVWLPIIPEAKNRENVIFRNYNGEDLILERDISNRKKVKEPKMITSHVITRTEIGKNKYDYDYRGEYKQVLFDKTNKFTVHARVLQFRSCGKTSTLLYDRNFAKTDQEAQKKAADLWKKMNKEQ
ncbi:MAG: hypothetical protein FWF55_07055 [Treponema sp.]|nr:hypothetical protein [Treponema sp.]